MSRLCSAVLVLLLAGCAGGAEVPDWQLDAAQAMHAFQRDYLVGDTRAADRDFDQVRTSLKRTGREDLLARAELARCAIRTAALELDDCPGFQALSEGASAEDRAYAEYLLGQGARRPAADAPLSRLVAAAVALRRGELSPMEITGAVDAASAQGWRRPLLAWLGVQAKRAEAAGDVQAATAARRRMDLISK